MYGLSNQFPNNIKILKMSYQSLKKVILIVFVIFFSFLSRIHSQTTQEEYNYLTKGYKIQVESGLDVKKGYTIKDLGNWGLNSGSESRSCEFKALIRQGQTTPCAVLLIYKRTDIAEGIKHYICIPSHDAPEYIWNQTLDFVNQNINGGVNISMNKTIVWSLMKFSASLSSKY